MWEWRGGVVAIVAVWVCSLTCPLAFYHTLQMSQLYEMQQLDKIKAICQVAEDDMGKLSEVRERGGGRGCAGLWRWRG